MLSLRQKLSLGFVGLLAIILAIGAQSIVLLSQLGDSIDVIVRENYRSVVASQEMKEALERIDSGILFLLLGYETKGMNQIRVNESDFEKALHVELDNVTLPEEGEKAKLLQDLFAQYSAAVKALTESGLPGDGRRSDYFEKLLPLFEQIKTTADNILQMNQKNMNDANDEARRRAASARHQMYFLLIVGAVMAGGFMFFTRRWILLPIARLIRSAEDIRAGNLDLVVKIDSQDEIGQLSEAFNSMTESLRKARRTRDAQLAQIQDTVQQAFNSLPDSIAVVDLDGRVEVATEAAASAFGFRPNTQIQSLPLDWLMPLFHEALKNSYPTLSNRAQPSIQCFINGDERYFCPKAVPIRDREKQPTAVMFILSDMTQQRQQDDLKRGVISTVSHELKTPLTSVRMAIHLLLEEDLGTLNEKQSEVLIAAEEDSDRLNRILENLLDIGRIESGKARLDFQSVSPHILALDSVEPFRSACQDCGVSMVVKLPDDLPEVWADPTRVSHVFANLFSNALKYTNPGGAITLSAAADEAYVRFSVSDTGKGIPERYLQTIFEQFFRIPGQESDSGAGLGLAIAKEIVEAHGGTITAESREAEGSILTFSLKRADCVLVEANSI
ncbi:MAG: ATP-binding protein [Desulfomonilaceae bacterium]